MSETYAIMMNVMGDWVVYDRGLSDEQAIHRVATILSETCGGDVYAVPDADADTYNGQEVDGYPSTVLRADGTVYHRPVIERACVCEGGHAGSSHLNEAGGYCCPHYGNTCGFHPEHEEQ